ncbi:alpha/beta hydrolase [Sporosarcina gallistercoris]|uniref:alpha/beta hydrolase n=1 Tax=Sporosarcina gallistercoris TaxID=2762245 RepID=UPI003D2E3FBC
MKRKIAIALGLLIVSLLVALVLAGNYFYNQGIKRGTEVKLHSESEAVNDIASDADQALLKEAKIWYAEQPKNTITMQSYDNLKLKAQFIKNNKNETHRAVILAHGFRNTGEDMGKYAKFYYDRGFDILLPDARGHGDSEGDYIGYGWHERLDYKDWIKYLIQQHDAEQIILQGNSMGAATVLMTSGEKLPKQVKGIIADSSYSTVKKELAHQLKSIYGLPAFPLLDVTSIIAKIRAGYTLQEASAVDQVRKNKVPLLLIHGDADDLVPTEMATELNKAASGDNELWIVPDAGHTKAYDNITGEYEEKLSRFLDKVLD